MSSPRPALKRSTSKVRFSTGDIADELPDPAHPLAHGDDSDHTDLEDESMYDEDAHPFDEISIAPSMSHAGDEHDLDEDVHEYVPEREHEHGERNDHGPDENGYTLPTPRSRRGYINSAPRPSITGLFGRELPAGHEPNIPISPRGSTCAQGHDPSYHSPGRHDTPPRSALRSSFAQPGFGPGADPQEGTSPLRLQRHSIQAVSDMDGTGVGARRESAPPAPSALKGGRGHPAQILDPRGYRRYEEYEHPSPKGERDRLSPVPPYSPRRSFGRGDHGWATEKDGWAPPSRGGDRGRRTSDQWAAMNTAGRHDSDATLQGDYEEKVKPYRPRSVSETSFEPAPIPVRRSTREMEKGSPLPDAAAEKDEFRPQPGILSQLLRFGRGTSMRQRTHSRASAVSADATADGLPTLKTLGLKRNDSFASTVFGAEELDADDPRITGVKKKKRRASWRDLPFVRAGSIVGSLSKKKRAASIQLHVADILTRQSFILKLAKALMTFGAPSHRIESQLAATALVLEIDAQFIHFPSIVIASFGDADTRTSETHFIKATTGLELGKLHRTHSIYRAVVHDEMDAAEGTKQIHALLKAPQEYGFWTLMALAFLSSGLIAPMGFSGSVLDGLAAGALGTLLTFLQMNVASKNAMYSNIFEISIATVISFVARGLSETGYCCYQAVASSGVVLILPGYVILCGSLELASKNIVAGSVRMVYAIIYSLFLGFGITIGSDLFYVVDSPARRAAEAALSVSTSYISLTGSFIAANSTFAPLEGTFTFSNATTDQIVASLQQGAITCLREPDWPWWRQEMPAIYLLGLIPLYSALTALWCFQPLRSKELPVMVFISCVGYFTNSLANKFIFDRSDVVSAIGAFMIGILGNIYSRVFSGTAFTAMVPGVLFLVPSGISAAGGLAMTSTIHRADSYSQGLIIGFRMIQVAIGITIELRFQLISQVGLFGSGFLIYSFGRKKNAALFAF